MSFKEGLERLRIIAETLDDDDPDKLEMLNVDGDYDALINWALKKRREYLAYEKAAKEIAEKYTATKKSYANKADGMKDVIGYIMTAANEEKFKSEYGSASFRKIAPKPIITDESKLPEKFFKKTIDKTAINKAIKDGEAIDGVAMDNGGQTISIR